MKKEKKKKEQSWPKRVGPRELVYMGPALSNARHEEVCIAKRTDLEHMT